MIFLIHYDRNGSRLVSVREFGDVARSEASDAKLELEISLINAGGMHEVVLLEAQSESDLKKTHRRYFDTLEQLKTADRSSGESNTQAATKQRS